MLPWLGTADAGHGRRDSRRPVRRRPRRVHADPPGALSQVGQRYPRVRGLCLQDTVQVETIFQFHILYFNSHTAIQFFTVYQAIYVINILQKINLCFHQIIPDNVFINMHVLCEIGKELAVCHAPPFECRCSVLSISIIIDRPAAARTVPCQGNVFIFKNYFLCKWNFVLIT